LARQELAEAKGRIGSDQAAHRDLFEEIVVLEAEMARFEDFLHLVDRAHEAEIPQAVQVAIPPAETDRGLEASLQFVGQAGRDPAKAVPLCLQALSCYEVMERKGWSSSPEALGSGQVQKVRRIIYEELLWLAQDVVTRGQDHGSGRKMTRADS